VSYTCSLKAQNYIIYNLFSRFPSTEGQNESTNWIYGVHGRRKSAVSYRSEPDFNPRTNGYTTLPPLQSTSGIASDLETNSGSFCMFYCIFTKSRHNFFIFHVHLINATLLQSIGYFWERIKIVFNFALEFSIFRLQQSVIFFRPYLRPIPKSKNYTNYSQFR